MTSKLEREIEQLRLKLTYTREGREIPLEDPVAMKRATGVVEFWDQEYEQAHGTRDLAFAKKDAVTLHKLEKMFQPSTRLGWMIREFHAEENEWLEEGGWSVAQFAARVRGLNLRWVKEVQEPALRREKEQLSRDLAAALRDSKVSNVIDGMFQQKRKGA